MWGVDTEDYQWNSTTWSSIVSAVGTPEVVGGYIVGPSNTLTSAQASFLEGEGAQMLLIYDPGVTTFTTQGATYSNAAVKAAVAIGATGGEAIYIDIEPGSYITANFVDAWYTDIVKDGYIPGFYEDSVDASGKYQFEGAFCGAPSAAKSGSYLYTPEMQYGSSWNESSAPSTYNPYVTGCESQGQVAGWQYLINDPSPIIDADEFAQVGLYG